MSKYKLTITRTDEPIATATEASGANGPTTIYVHEIENEADAHRLIHELTRPKRAYTKRTAGSARASAS